MRRACLILSQVVLLAGGAPQIAAQTCGKAEVAAAIDEAGAKLRALHSENNPRLQARLRLLAERQGWTDGGDVERKALAFLQDEEARTLDEQASQLLVKLDQLGDERARNEPTCARLNDARTTAQQLVEVTTAKSAHISVKLDAALKPGGPPATTAPKKEAKAESVRPPPAPQVADAAPVRPKTAQPWDTQTVQEAPRGAPAAPEVLAQLPPRGSESHELEFTAEEIAAAGRGFFGSISAGLASVIEYAFHTYGRPTGYILGTEGGGALVAGLRYGEGTLVTKAAGERKVYWQGPTIGYDIGLAGSRAMVLVYSLRDSEELFARFAGVDGSAYLVGGVGITFLKKGRVVLAPIRTGLGVRLGANVGYLKFTARPSLNPF